MPPTPAPLPWPLTPLGLPQPWGSSQPVGFSGHGLPQPWGSPNLGLLCSMGSPGLGPHSLGAQPLESTVLGPNPWYPQPWGFLNLGAPPPFGLPQSWGFPPRYWGSHTWGAHSLEAPSVWLSPRPWCFRGLGAHAALGLPWPWGSPTLGHGLGNPATLLPALELPGCGAPAVSGPLR